MDTLTHLVLGATIGVTFSPKHRTTQMMLAGSALQVLPDADVLANLGTSPEAALLIHRGFTHSILFAFLCALFLSAWLPHSRTLNRSPGYWLLFSLTQLLTHDLLDSFNAYGTALFIPFSFERISFHSLFVIDPLFSIVPGIAVLLALWFRRKVLFRVVIPFLALIWCVCYLLVSVWIKDVVDSKVQASALFRKEKIIRYLSTPMPFTTLAWYIIAEVPEGFYVGYRSVFQREGATSFRFVQRGEQRAVRYDHRPDVVRLKTFSDGYWLITADQHKDVFADLRFGVRPGWKAGQELTTDDFVFRYELEEGADNRGVLQRGRITGWGMEGMYGLIEKIFPTVTTDQSSR